MDQEVTLKEVFHVIKKRLWIVVVVTVLFTVIGGIYNTYFNTILYQSSSRIIINADEEYRKTLQVIIKDSTIMEKVVQDLNLDKSPEELAGQINVQSIDESQVVSIEVTDTDPELATNVANTTAKIFKNEIPNIVNIDQQFPDAKITSGQIVQLLSDAKIASKPINENQNLSIMIGFLIGLIAGIGLVFLLEYLDDSVKSEDDVEELLGVPVLGRISKMKKRNLKMKNRRRQEVEFRGETIGSK
jgi:capsular polysaccharide biosynthesis protein